MNNINNTDDDDDEFELDDESTPEDDAVFSKAFGAELLDSRLSGNELRLYLWLKYRCRASKQAKGLDKYDRSYRFKWSTIAEDLGVSRRSITEWSAVLENLGFLFITEIKDPKTGKKATTKKTLRAPSKIYGSERLINFVSCLRRGRTADDLNFAQSVGLEPDDKIRPPKLRATRASIQTDHGNDGSHGHAMGTTVLTVHGNDGSHGPWERRFSPYKDGADAETNKDGTDVVDKDNLYITRKKRFNNPFGGEREDGINIKSSSNKLEIPSSLSEKRDSAQPDNLVPSVKQTINSDNRAEFIKMGWERAENKLSRVTEKNEIKRRGRPPMNKENKSALKLIEMQWKDLFHGNFAGVQCLDWPKYQAKFVDELLTAYGHDKVKRGFEHFFANWDTFKRTDWRAKKDPDKYLIPTISMFLQEKEQIMAKVELGKAKTANSNVFVPDENGI